MKGSLHTDELLGAVVARETGLRTGRRISHVFIMDVPTYHKVLIVTDAAINIAPTLEDKVDICQNAIDLAIALGVDTAEGRDPRRGRDGQLEDAGDDRRRRAVQDGRPRADHGRRCSTARSRSTTRSARTRRRSRASDRRSPAIPTSCSCPISRPGNILAKQLTFLANADSAGLVLGARVPIILTSRADSVRSRIASCAVAMLAAHARRTGAFKPRCESRMNDYALVAQRRLVEPEVLRLSPGRKRFVDARSAGQIEGIGTSPAVLGERRRRHADR